MSTILKALQRLEDEKNSGKDRSLNEQVVARRSGAVAKSRWAVIGVALLSGIAVGSTALFFWPDGGAPAANGVTEAAQPVVASSATQSKPAQRVPKSPARALGADPSARAKQSEPTADRATTPALPMVEVVERLERKSPADSAVADASALELVVAESSALEPSGPGTNRPGDNKWTPLAVSQNSGWADLLGKGGSGIGSQISEAALSIGGTFLDDIQVNFLVQATQAHEATRSLTAPRLTLFNGQRAYVMVATEQAYVSDLDPEISENVVAYDTTVDIIPTGSVLDVEAVISADRRYVTLTVRPYVSTLNGFSSYAVIATTADPNTGIPLTGEGFIQLPNFTIQTLETTVSVPDGGTLLLGGQRTSIEVEREMGVPLLNKIPILNRMFSNRSMVRDEQTLLILIRPKIIIQREEEERQHPD